MSRKVANMQIFDDEKSLLRQKKIVITFKEDYVFTQAVANILSKRSLIYQGIFYNFESPADKSLAAGAPYRLQLSNSFDLVLVENNCFLEPNYVIIDGVPDAITIDQARTSYKDIAYGVTVQKIKQRGQETQKFCLLAYDFKSNTN